MPVVFDISPAVVIAVAAELGELDPTLSDEFWADCLEYVSAYDLTKSGESVATNRFFKINLAAHLATMTARGYDGGGVGPVLSEAAGGLRRSYAFQSMADGGTGLGLSSYGITCLQILRSSFCLLPIVG